MKLFEKLGEGTDLTTSPDLPGLGDRISLDLDGLAAQVQFKSAETGKSRVIAEIALGRVPFTAEDAMLRREILTRLATGGDTLRLSPDQRLMARHSEIVDAPENGVDRAKAATLALLPLMRLVREFRGFLPAA